MAWFVVYEHIRRNSANPPLKGNKILRTTHPIAWAASPSKEYERAGFITTLLFFTEIPDDLIEVAAKWCGVEE